MVLMFQRTHDLVDQSLTSLWEKVISFLARFERIVLIVILVGIIISIIGLSLVLTGNYFNVPLPTVGPTTNSSSSPTPLSSSSSSVASFVPTTNVTTAPGQTGYVSSSSVNGTGLQVYGGDLHGDSIQWGKNYVGASKTVSFHLQSTSDVPITIDFYVTDYVPAGIGPYLFLSWNYNGSQINPGEQISLTFTLTLPYSQDFQDYLANNKVSSFGFNINIYSVSS